MRFFPLFLYIFILTSCFNHRLMYFHILLLFFLFFNVFLFIRSAPYPLLAHINDLFFVQVLSSLLIAYTLLDSSNSKANITRKFIINIQKTISHRMRNGKGRIEMSIRMCVFVFKLDKRVLIWTGELTKKKTTITHSSVINRMFSLS